MLGIMSQATQASVDVYYNSLVAAMAANQINTPLRVAHFLAQLGTESGDFLYSEEIASGQEYQGRTDLGNTQPGDGIRFKGRGLIQLTGRSNYAAYGTARGKDYVTEPNNKLISSDPALAVDVSVWFWTKNNLNRFADADNVVGLTKAINGGDNGLDDRKAHLRRAKCLLVR
jgi:putative chitinase